MGDVAVSREPGPSRRRVGPGLDGQSSHAGLLMTWNDVLLDLRVRWRALLLSFRRRNLRNNEIALMRGQQLAVLGLRGATTVYDVDSTGTMRRLATPDTGGRTLVEDAITYFQTADELYRRGGYRFDRAVPRPTIASGSR